MIALSCCHASYLTFHHKENMVFTNKLVSKRFQISKYDVISIIKYAFLVLIAPTAIYFIDVYQGGGEVSYKAVVAYMTTLGLIAAKKYLTDYTKEIKKSADYIETQYDKDIKE